MQLSKINLFAAGMVFMLSITSAQASDLDDAMISYRDCTESAMPLLDDGKSDAETIAMGLHAQCRSQFEGVRQVVPKLSREELLKIVQPHVVQSVLKYRVMKASAQQKQAKATKPRS